MLKTDRLFSDHMVLQRGKEIKIWGTCTGENSANPIKVSLSEKTVEAHRDESGKWTAVFPPLEADRGLTLTVENGTDRIEIKDVNIGEVWVAAGQSNMEFYMKYDADCKLEKDHCENPDIRFFDVPEVCYPGQEDEYDYSRMGFWRRCTPENLDYFSAVAYYFAKKISRELDVPVGIIGCNRGGSIAGAWMSREELKAHGQVWLDDYADMQETGKDLDDFRKTPMADTGNPFADPINEEILFGITRQKQLEIMAQMPKELQEPKPGFNNRPGCLYELMLKQIVPCTVRGILWYQGESDSPHAEAYKEIFRDLIRSWRNLWGEQLPFCCVQLAPFGEWMACDGESFPIIRKAQKEISEEEKGVYLVSSSDVGMQYDIHPKRKWPVGERLALCAQKYVYGMDVCADAPETERAYVQDSQLFMEFKMDGKYLEIKGDKLNALKLIVCNGENTYKLSYREEQIYTKSKTLVIPLDTEDQMPEQSNGNIRVEYAQSGYYEVNLYSDAGIPAMPFIFEITK